MELLNKISGFLGINSKKDIEQLQKTIETQSLLIKQSDESKPETFVSMMARETKEAEDVQNTIKRRVGVKELQLLYLNNQYIFRSVNVRADELISRGYKIIGDDEEGIKKCQELINHSGGDNLFWQFSINTDIAGDGYLEKVPNQSKSAIKLLKHLNPINFGFWTEQEQKDRIIVNKSGRPEAYMQVVTDNEGKEERIKVVKERISHLRFNTFADEFTGVSTLQPVYTTAIRLMNMEHAAAQAAVKTANPTWVVSTQSKSPRDLGMWAKILGRISAQDVVFLPEGVSIELKSPGNENFSDYSSYFLDAVVAASGVPKSVLTGGGEKGSGNRSTVQTLSKHFYSIIRANQKYIEEVFNDIFKDYAIMGGFNPPKLIFNDIAEDADRNSQSAIELYAGGLITLEEGRSLVGLDTSKDIKQELENKISQIVNSNPGKEENKEDMKVWHPPEPGSPAGSQKNEKKIKKLDPNIKSVR